MNYALAVVNGQPLNTEAFPRDPNAAKDIAGRVGTRLKPIESLTLEGGLSFYDGKGFSPGRDVTKDQIAWRFLAPAGITGLWQITKRGKDNMSPDERIALDMEYAMKNSFWLDMKILLSTFPALLQKEKV